MLVNTIGERAITDIRVPCIDCTMISLRNVYPPTPPLKRLCARFLREGEFFPWLKVEEPVQVQEREPMAEGLRTLLNASDLDFALEIPENLVQATTFDCLSPNGKPSLTSLTTN